MADNVDDAWNRVESWLRLNAPAVWRRLGPPATDAELAEVEQVHGVRLPGDLAAWWQRSNGIIGDPVTIATIILGTHTPASTHDSIARDVFGMDLTKQQARDDADYRSGLETYRSDSAGWANDEWVWLNEWITIGLDSDSLFVDCRSGAHHGCVMTAFRDGGQIGPRWPSITAMWTEIADLLESVNARDKPEMIELDDGQEWWIPSSWWA
ncbi:SMI1/KNR4 family protein [Winogradskya humida]|uniref:Knr4/Smi1-like domain-containing protein n=1 Tax=Winogradskya humida TaxID=113566 RepID=A0ABQ3ZTY3_9ACTN|nr:SMI1/KNR4 family protein [Actinoplanes humidus]GIE22052.1 hypothetical protein Ahu01nite_051540 [Actinoplanes humidus]